MQQQINLYLALPKQPKFSFTPIFVLQIAAWFIVLLLMFSVLEEIYIVMQDARLDYYTLKANAANSALAAATKRYDVAAKNLKLKNENQQLTVQITEKKQLLHIIGNVSSSAQYTGFSKLLTAVASAITPDVWLKRIEIKQGGQQITLTGTAAASTHVIEFLKRLSTQPAFADRAFKILRLGDTKDQQGQVDFTLSTQPAAPTNPENPAETHHE